MQIGVTLCPDEDPLNAPSQHDTVPAGQETEYPFETGTLLLRRFRVLRLIGRGGMGLVYEAIDQRLEKRIVIKCAKPGFQQSLPPEARSATRVAHPNVCKTYEIHTVQTPEGEVDFLTMEYLDGNTLADRLSCNGPLSIEEATEVLRQICEGLQEAHRSGVIHGDLKPGNIILKRHGDAFIPVITDFGLASQTAALADSALLFPVRGGTPAFMAPELRRGGKSSIASDIYALGVLLYEMLTGHLPPVDEHAHAYNRNAIRHDLSRFGRTFRDLVVRSLDPDPSHRPAGAAEIARALTSRTRNRRLLLVAGMTAIALLGGPLVAYQPVPNPPRLALLPFDAPPGQSAVAEDYLNATFQFLKRAAQRNGRFAVFRLAERPELPYLCTNLHLTHALFVRLSREDNSVSVRASIVDVCTQQTLKESVFQYSPGEATLTPTSLAATVAGALHLPSVTDSRQDPGLRDADYLAGLAHLQMDSELIRAIESLSRAANRLSQSPAIWAELGEAYRMQARINGDDDFKTLALKCATRAQSLNPDAPSVCRLQGFLHLDAGLYASAVDDFSRAVELEPENPRAYLGLARTYHKMGRTRDALQTTARAIQLGPNDAECFILLGTIHYDLGQFDKSAQQFERAVQIAPQAPQAHRDLALAHIKAGKYLLAEQELETSLRLGETLDAHADLGATLDYLRRYADAIAQYKRSVEMAPNDYISWIDLADDYRRIGDQKDSIQSYRRALQLSRQQVLANPQDGEARGFVGYVLARVGEEQQAEYELHQALQIPPRTAVVCRTAALAYEALRERQKTLAVLEEAPYAVIHDLSQQPDTSDLCRDPRFIQLLKRQY